MRFKLLVAASLASATGAAVAQDTKPDVVVKGQKNVSGWQVATSKHFVVYSNDSTDHLRAFTTKLEKFDKAIRVWHQAPEDVRGASARVTVFAVSNMSELQKLYGGDTAAGFYDPRAGASVAFVPLNAGEGADYGMKPQAILFHEYTHHWMLTNWTDAAFPPWYVEGAAELHATAEFRPEGVSFGAVPLYRGYTVDNYSLLPADQLLKPDPGRLTDLSRDALYSRGWLLAHYVTFDEGRRKQFAAYIAAINAGKPASEAANALGGAGSLALKLNAYLMKIKRAHPYFTAPNSQLQIDDITIRTLSPAEAAAMPAYMASNRGVNATNAPVVVAQARAVAARFPDDAFVENELAEAEYDACNANKKADAACFARAEAAADRAAATDATSVHALIYKGRAEEAAAKKAKESDPVKWTAIRRWYLAANKVDHDAPQPLVRYYESFAAAKQPPTKNAEDGLLYAYQLAPYDPGVRMDAGKVLLGRNLAAPARTAIAPVAYNTDDRVASEAALKVLNALDAGGIAAAQVALKKVEDDAEAKRAKENGG